MSPSQLHSLLKSNSLDKLKAAVASASKTNFNDDGVWKLTTDKAGNGAAIIRFLPAPPPETVPFVSYYRHAFDGPNGWYIELSRTTAGSEESDPCGEYNSRLWKTNDKDFQDQARKQARKLTYVSNIYVVQDKANPDNEGKVFLYRYGKKIFEKIQKALTPEFEGDEAFDPFHVLDGANFRLRQKKQGGYPNYDDSMFEAPSPMLKGNETAIMEVLEKLNPIASIISPDKFKSYDELKKKLDKVMGFDTSMYLTPAEAGVSVGGAARRSMGRPTDNDEPAAPLPSSNARQWTPPPVHDDDDELDTRLSKFDDDDE